MENLEIVQLPLPSAGQCSGVHSVSEIVHEKPVSVFSVHKQSFDTKHCYEMNELLSRLVSTLQSPMAQNLQIITTPMLDHVFCEDMQKPVLVCWYKKGES